MSKLTEKELESLIARGILEFRYMGESDEIAAQEFISIIRKHTGEELLETFAKRPRWGNRGIEVIITEICKLR